MIEQTDNNFRALFLIKFTQELIKHSRGEVFVLDTALKEEKKEFKEKIKQTIEKPKLEKEFKDLNYSIASQEKKIGKNLQPPRIQRLKIRPRPPLSPFMKVPQVRLPPRLRYLRPIPKKVEIDLGKLNPLIKDFAVRTIQCNGPDEKIIVEGGMGRKATEVVLSKDEIDEVINNFSKKAKIPVDEGIVRIFVGNLNLLAITSEVVSPKFLIKKISFREQMPMRMPMPPGMMR
jgi:hypothetical protein